MSKSKTETALLEYERRLKDWARGNLVSRGAKPDWRQFSGMTEMLAKWVVVKVRRETGSKEV